MQPGRTRLQSPFGYSTFRYTYDSSHAPLLTVCMKYSQSGRVYISKTGLFHGQLLNVQPCCGPLISSLVSCSPSCENGGICNDDNTCLCPPGYLGNRCSEQGQ